MRRIRLDLLREIAAVKAGGYLEEAFQLGAVDGEYLTMQESDYRAWKKRFTGLGDHIQTLAGPVVRLLDFAIGTDLANCQGCKQRQKSLNSLTLPLLTSLTWRNDDVNSPISSPTLESLLFDSGIDLGRIDPDLPDTDWALVDARWLATEGASWLLTKCQEDVGAPERNAADCDDFAECAATEMHRLHRKTSIGPGPDQRAAACAIAFGKFSFTRDDGNEHRINWFVSRGPDLKSQLKFFEPQTGMIVELSATEKASCIFISS